MRAYRASNSTDSGFRGRRQLSQTERRRVDRSLGCRVVDVLEGRPECHGANLDDAHEQ